MPHSSLLFNSFIYFSLLSHAGNFAEINFIYSSTLYVIPFKIQVVLIRHYKCMPGFFQIPKTLLELYLTMAFSYLSDEFLISSMLVKQSSFSLLLGTEKGHKGPCMTNMEVVASL